jgi:predicted ATP-dependent protease
MLDEEVVAAVREGRFHVYAVSSVDEAMEILTGIPAGERKEDGTFEEGTLNDLVDRKIRRALELLQRLEGRPEGEKPKEERREIEVTS